MRPIGCAPELRPETLLPLPGGLLTIHGRVPVGEHVRLAMKKRVYEILEAATPGDRTSWAVDVFLITLISLNVLALALGTVDEAYQAAPGLFIWFERASILVFTAEYLLRVWSCTADPRYSSSMTGRLRFVVSPFMIIDLIVILPFFVLLGLSLPGYDLRFFRGNPSGRASCPVDPLLSRFFGPCRWRWQPGRAS